MSITRRTFLTGCAACSAALGATGKSHGWPVPQSDCGESVNFDDPGDGCRIAGSQAGDLLQHVKYEYSSGNPILDDGFLSTHVIVEKYFDVRADLYFYNDKDGPNAYALPFNIDGQCDDSTGSVIFGTTLLSNEMSSNGSMWGSSLSIIVAHEFAHIRQFHEGLFGSTPFKELHADFLAGWAVARMNINGFGGGVDPFIAARSVYSKGNFNFNDPTFHGTPQQRANSMLAGYDFAMTTSVNIDDAFQAGLKFLQPS